MDQELHRPVLLQETLAALACHPGGWWVDGTVGLGGHAVAILDATGPDGRLLGCDRDGLALERARLRLLPYGDRAVLRHADHRDLPGIVDALALGPLDGVLLDLGVSSLQLDDPARGFSFRKDGPLDMRMDRSQQTTAADLVNRLPEAEIASILKRFGEEPAARRIARVIAAARERAPFASTRHLAEVVARAAAGRGAGGRGADRVHPATRSFQALRIAVNQELVGLDSLIEELTLRTRPGGRLAILSFHSLEDRIVKNTFRGLARRCRCPRGLPVCGCGRPDLVRLPARRPVRPSAEEARDNPRSRSARLRVAERLPVSRQAGGGLAAERGGRS